MCSAVRPSVGSGEDGPLSRPSRVVIGYRSDHLLGELSAEGLLGTVIRNPSRVCNQLLVPGGVGPLRGWSPERLVTAEGGWVKFVKILPETLSHSCRYGFERSGAFLGSSGSGGFRVVPSWVCHRALTMYNTVVYRPTAYFLAV